MSIGLHINPEDNHTISPVEHEIRKRIWWGSFVLDRTLSMKFGRPPSIALLDALDMDLPPEVDDQYITNFNQFPRQPRDDPARITAHHISERPQSGYQYKNLNAGPTGLLLDRKYVITRRTIEVMVEWPPEYLTKASNLPGGIDLTRQRNVLYIRYVQLRLLVLRPSVLLLGKTGFQDRFLHAIATECARRCVSCARETIQIVLQRVGLFVEKDWNNESLAKSLDEGMEFCRSSSQQSRIAHRYMMLLERHIDQLHENLGRNGGGTIRRPGPNGNIVHQFDPVQDSFFYPGMDSGSGQSGFNPENVSMADVACIDDTHVDLHEV
ncbi:fungal-specific transcription factor domain-containing protein [Aspergillus pseudoustus]|uniref:Fungal-specific transcription factor domain-containing protein n=1 Tax=Aspergillus pseudoustus TaxID=1810923 RepID=A0ABR4KFH0_9EURO